MASCSTMRKIDNDAIEKIGIPGVVLMENAGLTVVEEIKKTLGELSYKSVIIFCGRGNNGGDGFVIARHLFNAGVNVLVVLVAETKDIKGDALTNFKIIQKLGVKIIQSVDGQYLEEIAASLYLCDMVVDAIFGTGIKGTVSDAVAAIFDLINSSGRCVLSVDIPSGINGDSGKICGSCVNANKTVSFVLPKVGLLNYPAADYVGHLVVSDISIPMSIIQQQNININTIEKDYIKGLLPVRIANSNKGDYGKVLIIAGSTGMTGAAALAGLAAVRAGAGLVTVGIPKSLNPVMEIKLTEVMTLPLEEDDDGILVYSSIDKILDKMRKTDVLVFGPGLSVNQGIADILEAVLRQSNIPVVIDADGINALSANINVLKECKCPIIITPHPGEMSRLTGLEIPSIEADRIEIAKNFAAQWNVTVVLKGARTIIAHPNGEVFINCTGNPGMATGGTGDVLAGVIASLIGQGLEAFDAAVAGVYIHGAAGDLQAFEKGEYGLIASDIINGIPAVLQQLALGK
ncbi:NAD(P)H-hydrate dehydratase [Petroclostridium sp. X23]|uniref:NAD(P)H-hydrate dehydratase n=1 Tax=Petroclostridium sp. X23 TaxID=3045146 RepID=UPI0024ACDED1|nr:NAD(P)H-hydrate dehydratase [Petroclostridium sp. X23]WHH61749.1 NAD(P)H-hydrate dehydratase [Petroclostridium sp. X23]